ncbi:hypothetical protein Theos_2385 (plasmid) [Thermus oshimai JL-2]|uniref:CHAD domain-containing protein n=1 Tax=Thermus oshimai JL-2 TaxID=751945 RepID=K7R8H6_THEOS|nr:CHAD domain-containing protein [Thermus oshimai]AFV77369.1 hypothetical protein Theos_2385 [Thermus oshimai JL-2]
MIPLGPWLEHLERHLPLALSGEDSEGVHQVRVAGRRLRVWLWLGRYRVLGEDLGWLVRGLGPLRDLEVLLQIGPPPPLANWLRRQREEARGKALILLQSPRLEGLLQALRTLPPLETGRAGRRLERLEIRAGQALEACRQDPTPEALHTLRRALRRLRYAREYLGKGTKELKTLQEVLGAFQDLTVALAHLEAFEREAKPLPRYRQALQRRREKAWAEVQRALLDRALTSVP